jgi:hypothetical protein
MKTYKTTAKHFAIFKEQVERELERFGLKNGQVKIKHGGGEEVGRAEMFQNWAGRQALITLSITWQEEITEHQLKMSAFHEVMELLFAPLKCLAIHYDLAQGQRERMADREQHGIIRTLENVVGYEE